MCAGGYQLGKEEQVLSKVTPVFFKVTPMDLQNPSLTSHLGHESLWMARALRVGPSSPETRYVP